METDRLSPPDPPINQLVGLESLSRERWTEYLALRRQGYTDQQLQTLALLEIAYQLAIR